MQKKFTKYQNINPLLLISLIFIFTPGFIQGQNINKTISCTTSSAYVKGIIKTEEGHPLEGCTITNKESNKVIQSESNGRFIIDANIGDTLLITRINYVSSTVAVTNHERVIEIILTRNVELESEVIVSTGYETIPRERSAGAFNTISRKVLDEQVSPNILDRLKNVSNLYFDYKNLIYKKGNNPITLRGLSSINSASDPLIILDNFPYTGDISNINPDDVENITILKDATAASIWGAKSANGVIVITTKKSAVNQPVSINFSSAITVSNLPKLNTYPEISVKDYIDVESYLFGKKYKLSDTSAETRPPLTPLYEMLLKRKKSLLTPMDSSDFVNHLLGVNSQKEYLNNFYRKGLTQQYNISLSGSGGKFSWLLSAGYNQIATSLLKNNSSKKNIHISNRYKPIDNLDLDLNIYYTNATANNSPTPGYKSIKVGNKYVPYLEFNDQNGNAVPVDRNYRGLYTDTAGSGELLDWKYYPLTDFHYQNTTSSTNNLLWNLQLSYKFLKRVKAIFSYQQEHQFSKSNNLSSVNSYYARDIINRFASRSGDPMNEFTNNIPIGDIFTSQSGEDNSKNMRAQLNYSNSWGRIVLTTLTGGEIRETKSTYGSSSTIYGYNKDPLTFGTVNYNTQYATFVDGSLQYIPGAPIPERSVVTRFASGYLNGSLSYANRYTLNFSLRKDAANTFGLKANDKWNPFWSIGGAWNMANESFFNVGWLSQLKIRSTLGIGGNVDPGKTALLILTSGTEPATNLPRRRVSSLNNPSLKWEQSRQLNIALDFETRSTRLSGSVDYYLKKGTDLYGPAPFDYTAWGLTNSITKNVAAMKGKGIEVSLTSKNIIRPILWQTTILFNYNSNKVTKYYLQSAETIGSYIAWEGRNITPIVGMPLYAFAAYRWGGLDEKGDPQGYLNGNLSKDYSHIFESTETEGNSSSIIYMGTADPKIFGSVMNTFNYKSFTLSANISYRLRYYFLRPSLSYNSLYSVGNGHAEYENRWQNPGDEKTTTVPAMVYTNYPQFSFRDLFYKYSEVNVLRADNIRFEYINLSYSLNRNIIKSGIIKELTLSANAANLGLIWRKNNEKLDPDYLYTAIPPKQFTIGIRATF